MEIQLQETAKAGSETTQPAQHPPNGTAAEEKQARKPVVAEKSLGQLLTECHQLFADTRIPLQAQLAVPRGGAGDVPAAVRSPEYEVEIAIVRKMREFRRKIAQEYGPYADIDLEELLNPPDRIASIITKSRKSLGLNNMQLDALMTSAMVMIESEHEQLKRLYRLASIVQGDDPDWQDLPMAADDELVASARDSIQQYLNNNVLFVEKMQDIRDKLVFIQARKKEFLRSLRDRFGPLYTSQSASASPGGINGDAF